MLGQEVSEALAQCCHLFLIYYLGTIFFLYNLWLGLSILNKLVILLFVKLNVFLRHTLFMLLQDSYVKMREVPVIWF